MTRRYLKPAIVGNLFTPTACAQQNEIRQVYQSVSTLSQEMTQFNQQTIKITQQDTLNAKSTRGAHLLPEAKTSARLESQIDTLRMSVGSITLGGDGSRLTLRIQGEPSDPLPALTVTVVSGQITGTTHSHQEINAQDQLISALADILAPSDVDIPLRLSVTPDKAGFIHIHDTQPVAVQQTFTLDPVPSGYLQPRLSYPLTTFHKSSLEVVLYGDLQQHSVKKCVEP